MPIPVLEDKMKELSMCVPRAFEKRAHGEIQVPYSTLRRVSPKTKVQQLLG